MGTRSSAPARPTRQQFAAYQAMYDHFNRMLFRGQLRPVLLNFSRAANSFGFFAPLRWEQGAGDDVTHEISLNPAHLKTREPRAVAATLVHEMVHCWQQEHGTPSRRGYHNAEWAEAMERVGLMPSATGEPGGPRVGYQMTHYIAEGGPFARAFEAMPDGCRLPWQCGEPDGSGRRRPKPAPVSKLKYSCPDCGLNVWGKPGLNVLCGECESQLEPADG